MDKLRAAVIGSGFGGLAAAIRLQAAGFQTVIFEKRDQPGGRAYVYSDHGFTFDAGPTVMCRDAVLERLEVPDTLFHLGVLCAFVAVGLAVCRITYARRLAE